jgi:putative membrane protein
MYGRVWANLIGHIGGPERAALDTRKRIMMMTPAASSIVAESQRMMFHMANQPKAGTPALDTSTILAFDRTRASYERTMMSWVRTATSLITFGFSVYKFFQIEVPTNTNAHRLIGPREFALALVIIGLVSLVLATLEYRQNIRFLDAQFGDTRRSLAVIMAALISLLGILALVLMLFRQ